MTSGGLLVGGQYADAADIPTADSIAKWALGGARRPDGRIRLGTSGAFVGNDVYNATAAGQSRSGAATRGATITYGISIQNDAASVPESYKVRATGSATSQYAVTYLNGATDITARVVAGTYRTQVLAPGAKQLVTVRVKVLPAAVTGSSVSRLVTVRSVDDPTKSDVVKLTGMRASAAP